MTTTRDLVKDERDQFAFHDDIVYLTETKRGLTHDTVREISALKNEPEWMLEFRLRAYEHFLKRPMPVWTDGLDRIDFDKIVYYRKPSEREEKSWDDVPDQIKATFERLTVGTDEPDYAALDRVIPHPVYAKQRWVAILNPSRRSFDDIVKPLVDEAHQRLAKAAGR